MKKQYAVFGLGKFGSSVAVTLEKLGCEVIAVDIAEEKVQEIADQVSYAMRADLHDTGVIQSLGLRNLDGAVVAIADNMESSIMATILSKEAGIPYVLAKAQDELHASILKKGRCRCDCISGDGDGKKSCQKSCLHKFCRLDRAITGL